MVARRFHEGRRSKSSRISRHARLKIENDERRTGRTEEGEDEERTEKDLLLIVREDLAASLVGEPRCTVGASGTAFVWILGRLSCLIRYGLEIRPPRADSGKGPARTKPGNGAHPSTLLPEKSLSRPFALTPPNGLIFLSFRPLLPPFCSNPRRHAHDSRDTLGRAITSVHR